MRRKETEEIFGDEIFGEDTDFSPKVLQTQQAENICGNGIEVKPPPMIFDELPQIVGTGVPIEMELMIKKVHAMYRMFPKVDYESTYNELVSLTVKTTSTPTLQLISQELHKVQAVKERLAEIMVKMGAIHAFKKRQVDILKEISIHFSREGSDAKRKGEATYRISEFESDFLAIDCLWRTATQILNNLDSTQEILSRRVTIIGHELRLLDLGRHSLPDYDFKGPSLVGEDIGKPTSIDNETEDPTEAEELEF